MTNEDKALWLMDYIQTLIREHRRRCGLDPVWDMRFDKAERSDRPLPEEVFEDIMEILDYEEANDD